MLQRLSLRTLALVALMTMPSQALDIDFEGNVELELRHFPNPARHQDMEDDFASLAAEIELGLFSPSGRHAVIIKPFARYDQHDHERSHGDLREAKYRYVNGSFEATLGVDKEFWGVTEFLHLVDIINQTDNVESIDGEQKLGQAMVKFSYASRYGTLSAYSLPFFRIRQYHDPETGRPNAGFIVDDNTSHFESGEGRRTDDYALRYQNNFGPFDIGLSWFDGTAREPQLLVPFPPEASGLANGLPMLQAHYAYLTQAGLDMQATLGPWLLKLEATQATQNRYLPDPLAHNRPSLRMAQEEVETFRATGGIEYTFYNLFDTGTDLGLVAEYMYDERKDDAPHPFGNDIGIGLRWTANDPQSTAILFGGLIDLDTDSSSISLEAERRLGRSFKAILEARFQDKVGENDDGEEDAFAAALADEDSIRFRLAYYF
ncbi:MAG: hypothetical protein ACPID4_03590 [Parvibaculales bacterium]